MRKTPKERLNPLWIAPILWKSEFRNVLALYIRQGYLSLFPEHTITLEAFIG